MTTPPQVSLGEGLTCGRDADSAVSSRSQPPYPFTGGLQQVTVSVSGQLIKDDDAEVKMIMAGQ